MSKATKEFVQVTEKKPGILKDAKSQIAEVEKKLKSDRKGEGYGLWAIKDGKTIKVVISKGSPPANYSQVEGQTLGEQILDKGKFNDNTKWKILESCAENHSE